MPAPKHVTILGGGLTGLVAAYRLGTSLPQTQITLLEASPRLGGWVQSERHRIPLPGRNVKEEEVWVTLEGGPRSIRPRGSKGAAGMLRLIRDLDLSSSLIPIPKNHPSAKNRFLLDPRTHRLVKLPSSPWSVLGRQPHLLRGFLPSILSEPFANRGSGIDESVDSFFRRRMGDVVADNLASAMVHGIYATDSRELSLRSTFGVLWEAEKKWGSVILGMLLGTKSSAEPRAERQEWKDLGELGKEREKWSLYGIQGGLGTLTARLAEALRSQGAEMCTGEPATHISPSADGVIIKTPKRTIQTSHLISALPPPTLHYLIPDLPHLQQPRTSVGVINLVLPLSPSELHPAGFGYLVPRCPASDNPEGVIGVIFDSSALPFPDEAERGMTKLTVMMGGPWWSSYPSISGQISPIPKNPQDLVGPSLAHLRRVFPVLERLEPALVVPRIHRDCIPTYTPGHGQRMRELHEAISGGQWAGKLSLVGNGYGGVGVNDCVYSAEAAVRALASGASATGLERWADFS